jgi:hypothetical protein
VGTRRDDISGQQRAQIAIEVMPPGRAYGVVSRLAGEHSVSRQTIYAIGERGRQMLETYLSPGRHGPHVGGNEIQVDRERLIRSSVVLTEVGVSQRDIVTCLGESLDISLSPSWVNARLAEIEAAAARVNVAWHPAVGETLSGDEIYSQGLPNLLVVGNETLYIYALTRQITCDGETWGCVLLDNPACAQFASDAGTGLAAGVKLAGMSLHQMDWDHLLRPMWGQVARLEEQAYTALQAVEARTVLFAQAHTSKRLEQHLATWERLQADAEDRVQRYDAFYQIARQIDEEFKLIDLHTGQLRDPLAGAERLRCLGQQLCAWSGRIYEKLGSYLVNLADALFAYQPTLTQTLTPLMTQWGAPAIQSLACLWQVEANAKRHPLPRLEHHVQQRQWEDYLDQAVALLGDHLWQAWEALTQVLERSWRGSMLAECINSCLRPLLNGRKHTDQGCLELFRFLHNVRPFRRGKRAGHSPAELVGLDVPADPLTLLGLAPKCQSNFSGF